MGDSKAPHFSRNVWEGIWTSLLPSGILTDPYGSLLSLPAPSPYSGSPPPVLPLSISLLSHQLWHIKQGESFWSPKRLQILTDYQAVHSPPTSPFFCHFFLLLSSGPYKCQRWFLSAGWWCMINSAFISSHLTVAFAFHQEQSVSTQASRGKDVISGIDNIVYQYCLGL